MALDLEGKKEDLGLYQSASEGVKFWLSVLTDLQNRVVEDVLIASVDGLTGFPDAINMISPPGVLSTRFATRFATWHLGITRPSWAI